MYDDGEDGEHRGVRFVKISSIFAKLDDFLNGTISFDRA